MKRFLIYALLGPPVGFAVLIVMTALLTPRMRGTPDNALFGAVALAIPAAYLVGLLPAMIVAVVDLLLSKRKLALWPRICACTAAGYIVTMLGTYGFRLPPNGRFLLFGLFGLVGAIPAALCAWLSGRDRTEADVPDAAQGPR
jgi:hypothetical protein